MMEEKNVKPEKKDEKGDKEGEEKKSLRKAISKYSPMAVKAAVVAFATGAMLVAGCTSVDRKTSDTDTAEATEVVDETDAENDVLGEMDIIEDSENDVDERDGPVRLDSIEEDPRPDTSEEDPTEDSVEDPVEEDALVDTSVDTESDGVASCEASDRVRVVTIAIHATETVGNIGVRYNGLSGADASYDILCGDTVVESGVTVPVGGVRVVDLSAHGFRTELRVSSADSSSSYVRVTVDAY